MLKIIVLISIAGVDDDGEREIVWMKEGILIKFPLPPRVVFAQLFVPIAERHRAARIKVLSSINENLSLIFI